MSENSDPISRGVEKFFSAQNEKNSVKVGDIEGYFDPFAKQVHPCISEVERDCMPATLQVHFIFARDDASWSRMQQQRLGENQWPS